MLYDYLSENYSNGDPIFLSDISGYSKDYIRQEMKRLTDEGRLERLYNGVYFLSYTTILGTKGNISMDKYIEAKYLTNNNKTIGYYVGLKLANMFGFTTQNPAIIEICTNVATTYQRKKNINGYQIIEYKPVAEIKNSNVSALRFLDLITSIDQLSEIKGDECKRKLQEFVKKTNVNFDEVKKYLSLYPAKTYKNIYDGGLMNELV